MSIEAQLIELAEDLDTSLYALRVAADVDGPFVILYDGDREARLTLVQARALATWLDHMPSEDSLWKQIRKIEGQP